MQRGVLQRWIIQWAGGQRYGAILKFARTLGVPNSTVHNWLRGHRPDEALLPKMAKILGKSTDELKAQFHRYNNVTRSFGSGDLPWQGGMQHAPVVATIGKGGFYFMFDAIVDEVIPVGVPTPAGKRFAAIHVKDGLGDYAPAGAYLLVIEATAQEIPDGKMAVVLDELKAQSVIGRIHHFQAKGEAMVEVTEPTPRAKPVRLPASHVQGRVMWVILRKD